jgi:hypothetical protein
MKVKVIKATLPTYWYADKIGEIYNVYDGPIEILGSMAYVTDGEGSVVNADDVDVIEGE